MTRRRLAPLTFTLRFTHGYLKRVLIVSPHFPPMNMADVHRVRQSLPYYREFGWDPVVLTVDPDLVEGNRDDLLLDTVPDDVEVHYASAFDYRTTRRFGLGSLALRSLPFLAREGSRLLRERHFDLVFFSTTQFPVLVLGRYWKRRFGVPYVIDMQDPWYTDYYAGRPRNERPPKYWFSGRLDRMLEPIAMRDIDGIMAVTWAYVEQLKERYPASIDLDRCREIAFGVSERDFEIAAGLDESVMEFLPPRLEGEIRCVYTGVCNSAMEPVLRLLFQALRHGLSSQPELFKRVRLYFIGTNYAPEGKTRPVVKPIAEECGVGEYVFERETRVPYLVALRLQLDADLLLLIGTRDADYVASKLYPYLFARRPTLAVLHERSAAVDRFREARAGTVVTFADPTKRDLVEDLAGKWTRLLEKAGSEFSVDEKPLRENSARRLAGKQAALFDAAVR